MVLYWPVCIISEISCIAGANFMNTLHVLESLLEKTCEFQPTYPPDDNSDHLPMALCAIQGLGGDENNIQSFYDEYSPGLLALGDTASARDPEKLELYREKFQFYRQELELSGTVDTLRRYFPALVSGLVGEAFHPLIRLSYGIEFNAPTEVAAGLAYLESYFVDFPIADEAVNLHEKIKEQASHPAKVYRSSSFSGILDEIREAGEYPVGQAEYLDDCARLALEVFQSTRNFFALHMVTATHAVRVCQEVVPQLDFLPALSGALLAVHIGIGRPEIGEAIPVSAMKVIDPEHRLKYAYSCLAESKIYPDLPYLDEIQAIKSIGLLPDWVRY